MLVEIHDRGASLSIGHAQFGTPLHSGVPAADLEEERWTTPPGHRSPTRRSARTSRRRSAARRPTRTWTTSIPTRTTLTATPTTRTRSAGALRRCIEPVGEGEFLAEHWERRPLVVERHEPGRFDDLLSEAEVERLVTSGGLRFPGFRLVKAGEQLAVRDYTTEIPWRPSSFTGTADVDRVLDAWERGATIVLQGLHLHRPELGAFCRSLERTLGHPAQVNAYYTPRAAQGLPVHHDTHDVFVLQVSGEKRWLVYEPALELPLRNQKYTAEMGGPGEPVHDLVLRPGDMLYLPRGWLHEALTSDSDSLHLTVGVNVVTWLDAFKWALEECGDELVFRRSIGDGDVNELVDVLRARLTTDAVERRAAQKLARTRRPIRDGQLSQLRAIEELDVDTEVELRETVLAYASEHNGSFELTFDGKEVAFPARIRDEVSWVLERDDPFTAADLPGDLDDESRLVLVRRLVREGLLRISAA
jgi:ribosomal protein L16 Arg81 hydroxylase